MLVELRMYKLQFGWNTSLQTWPLSDQGKDWGNTESFIFKDANWALIPKQFWSQVCNIEFLVVRFQL